VPYLTTAFSGALVGVIDNKVLRRTVCGKRILAGAAVGFLLGVDGAN
jgi:hypothetical protein